jgi:hypothetical protein
MATAIPANVAAGGQYLDRLLPGWRRKVDPDVLDVSHVCGCPLGQIFGDYDDAVDVLELSDADAVRLGFKPRGQQTYQRLTEAWRRLLAAA